MKLNLPVIPGAVKTFLNKTPFIRFLLPFMAGILTAIYIIPDTTAHRMLILLFLLLLVSYLVLRQKTRINAPFSLVLGAFLFMLGVELAYLKKDTHHESHYSHFIENKDQRYLVYICDIPQLKERSVKCHARILKQEIHGKFIDAEGEILIYFEKSDSMQMPVYGSRIVFYGMPQPIPGAKNPYEFDYRNYLSYKNIFHQVYLKKNTYLMDGMYQGNKLVDFAINLKSDLLSTLKENGLQGNEYAITAALMLGYDDEISGELMSAYSHTGTLHVLSVSGLHVGVLFIALNFLLRFPDKRFFSILKTVIILLCLWFYALLSGLSPSVVRATAMFSFVLFGLIINRKGQIYNSIFASAFIMLLFDPFLLLDTGFQLSYLAVAGIVFFYPYVYRWYAPENKFMLMIWKMFAVSLSAQIVTLPITLYYFHQFPVLFFVANLLVIPLSYVVMFGAVFIVIFSKIKFIAFSISWIVSKSVWIMNEFTFFIDRFKFSNISGINTDFIDMLLLFGLIFLLTHTLLNKSYLSLFSSLILVVFMLSNSILFSFERNEQKQLIVFQFPGESKIAFVNGEKAYYYSGTSLPLHSRSKQSIQSFNMYKSINLVSERAISNGFYQFMFSGKKYGWLIGGNLENYPSGKLACDYLILSGDPYVANIASIKTGQVIADGNNSYKTLAFLRLEFAGDPGHLWITKEKGAFIGE